MGNRKLSDLIVGMGRGVDSPLGGEVQVNEVRIFLFVEDPIGGEEADGKMFGVGFHPPKDSRGQLINRLSIIPARAFFISLLDHFMRIFDH